MTTAMAMAAFPSVSEAAAITIPTTTPIGIIIPATPIGGGMTAITIPAPASTSTTSGGAPSAGAIATAVTGPTVGITGIAAAIGADAATGATTGATSAASSAATGATTAATGGGQRR